MLIAVYPGAAAADGCIVYTCSCENSYASAWSFFARGAGLFKMDIDLSSSDDQTIKDTCEAACRTQDEDADQTGYVCKR